MRTFYSLIKSLVIQNQVGLNNKLNVSEHLAAYASSPTKTSFVIFHGCLCDLVNNTG